MSDNNTSEQKLTQLVLYVAERCEKHDLFGMVKLNKILFFSDRNAYIRLGKTITSGHYVKMAFGPVVDGFEALIGRLEEQRVVAVYERKMPDLITQKRVIALKPPKLSPLVTADEIAIVEDVIEWMRPMSAKQISDLSHEAVGWEVARLGEPIVFSTAIVPTRPRLLSESERQHALGLAQRLAEARGAAAQ
jgi:hypothetical protein